MVSATDPACPGGANSLVAWRPPNAGRFFVYEAVGRGTGEGAFAATRYLKWPVLSSLGQRLPQTGQFGPGIFG